MGYRDVLRVGRVGEHEHGRGVNHRRDNKVESRGLKIGCIQCVGKDIVVFLCG